jgi:hypothetical protein
MTGIPEDERDWTDRITLPMLAVPLMVCMGIVWLDPLLRLFSLEVILGGLALAGAGGYGLFRGLKWLSRWSRPAAVAVLLYIIGVIAFLWPVACVTAGGKLGTPIKHYCRCEGLSVTASPSGSDVTVTTYCLGWEIQDEWEQQTWPRLPLDQ